MRPFVQPKAVSTGGIRHGFSYTVHPCHGGGGGGCGAVVSPLPINMHDAFEVRIVAVVQVLDDLAVSRCLVRADGARAVEPDAVDGLP